MKRPFKRGLIILVVVLAFLVLWVVATLKVVPDSLELKRWLCSPISELKIWHLIVMFIITAGIARGE